MDFTNQSAGEFQESASAPYVPADLHPAKEDEDDRIDSKEVARRSGLSRRAVTSHARKDMIPSARQFGTKWTFDDATIRAWVKGRDEGTRTTTSASAAKPRGSARPSADGKSVKAFARLLAPSREKAGTPVSPDRATGRSPRAARHGST